MDYTSLLNYDKKIKLGVVGASQGFGYTALVQLKAVDQIDIRVVCSISVEESVDALVEIGYDEEKIIPCYSIEEMDSTREDDIIVVDDYKLVLEAGVLQSLKQQGT